MKKRAIQLLMLALAVISVGSLLSPVSAPAAPIDDKQAEAAQLEQQITDNGRRMDALNEQINSAQIALDEANVTITTANAQVAAATAKAHDLRAALAERAVSVYRQSGSEDGVANLDVKNTSDLATRRKYTDLAAQREKQLVNQLAQPVQHVECIQLTKSLPRRLSNPRLLGLLLLAQQLARAVAIAALR